MQMLTSKDQLLQEAERGHIFNGYCEGELTFKPTYKYNIGSSNYDTSYKVLAFLCLRIIFYIEQTGYNFVSCRQVWFMETCIN